MLILCIHDVVAADPASTWTVTEDELAAVIGACTRQRYEFITLDHLSDATASSVALTADDGRSGAVSWLLQKAPSLGVSATAFVVPGWIDDPDLMPEGERYSQIATWDEVAALRDAGHDLGSHGMTHVRLPNQTDERMTAEIRYSRDRIQSATGGTVRHFSAPYGRISEPVVREIKRAGYDTVSTTMPGVNSPDERRTGILHRLLLRRDLPNLGLPPEWGTW
jgi:peptidoglycan/xylan/chitin deacetylase (PgdA/CDA1 family)